MADGWRFDWCLPAWRDVGTEARDALHRLGVTVEPTTCRSATPLLPWAVDRAGLPRILVPPYDDPTLNWDGGVTAGVGAMPDAISETEWKMLLLRSFRQLAMARLPELLTARYRFSSTTMGVPWFVRRNGGTRVKPTEMAAGFRLWVDLAMIHAWEVLGGAGPATGGRPS